MKEFSLIEVAVRGLLLFPTLAFQLMVLAQPSLITGWFDTENKTKSLSFLGSQQVFFWILIRFWSQKCSN
jgi:hypothetical protein